MDISVCRKKHKCANTKDKTLISNRLWNLVTYFLIFGFLRVSRRPSKNSNGNKYFVKIFSVASLSVLLVQIGLCISSYFAYTTMVSIGQVYSFNWIARTLWLTIVFRFLAFLVITWLIAKPSAFLLNGWDKIEEVFLETFGIPLEVQGLFKTLNWMYLSYFIVPTTVLATLPLSTLSNVLKSINEFSAVLILTLNGITTGGFLGMEALYFILCFTFSSILEQIRKQLKRELREEFSCALINKVPKWKQVFILMGKQMKALNKWLSPIGLLSNISRLISFCTAAYLILVLTNYAYSTKNSDSKAADDKDKDYVIEEHDLFVVTYSALGSGFILALHSFLEVHYASKIQHGYKKIIRLITETDTSQLNINEKLEMNALVNVIRGRPTEVKYFQTTTVDWGMILSVLSLSITYLIILLQFKPIQ